MESELVNDVADVLIHVDEGLDSVHRQKISDQLRNQDGVVSVSNHDKTAHLLIVKYNNDQINSSELLTCVKNQGVHAELVGI